VSEDPAVAALPRVRFTLSAAEARRIALRAQGLDRRRPAAGSVPTMRGLQAVVDRIGLIQIDSVNVLARAHLMPLYSRLGPYDPNLLHRASGLPPRRLVETWAHEASFVPPETYRLLDWRRRNIATEAWGSIARVEQEQPDLVRAVRDCVAAHGPVTSREVHVLLDHGHVRDRDSWGWNWSAAKRALEFLFFTGEVAAARRNTQFERCYDLATRVIPAGIQAAVEVPEGEAIRALVEIGARAHGVGTEACLRDYFRLRPEPTRRALAELLEEGVLQPVTVEGWSRPAFLHRDARLPRRATARTLLSPFDPLLFERRRVRDMFGMRYRIEIYTPAKDRQFGYYVLPFLLGDRLAARVDLKADRSARVLRVLSVHSEPHPPADTVDELAVELSELARWLDLDGIEVAPAYLGAFARPLAARLGRAPGSADDADVRTGVVV
jgi:uncharacterized protein YcaQ